MVSLGTDLKINVHVEPIDGSTHLSECSFSCLFYTTNEKNGILIDKSEMINVDDDNYIAKVNTATIGVGSVFMKIEVLVPDGDYENGTRKEVSRVCTGIKICDKAV